MTTKKSKQVTHAVLVYQAGLANVFSVESFDLSPEKRNAKRLLQHAFTPCEWFARGLAAAGVRVTTWACNQPGDIVNAEWSNDLEAQPFSDKFSPVFN
jgi:hypothetical protein